MNYLMTLKEQIQFDLKKAIREGSQDKVSTLRMLLAAIVNKEKEKRRNLAKEHPEWTGPTLEEQSKPTDEEVIEVVLSEAKKRKEAIVEFGKGSRQDLVQKEKGELEILRSYLPEQLSGEEIKRLAKEAVQKTGAAGLKDMGRVMAELMPKVKGRAEGGLVGSIVKELLEDKSR